MKDGGSKDVVGELRRFFHREKIPHDAGILLAVSGGRDSMALALGMHRLAKFRWAIATVNHGLREEAASETAFVEAAAKKWDVEAFVLTLQPKKHKEGVLAWAREARYEALEKCRAENGFAFVAVAHHANDQAETVLVKLLRGGQVRGMRAKNGTVLRPLLQVSSDDIARFAKKHALAWCEDPSNLDRSHLRTRVRFDVLPALEKAAQRPAVSAICAWAERAGEDDDCLYAAAGALLAKARGRLTKQLIASTPPPILRRVVRLWWHKNLQENPAQTQVDALIAGACVAVARGRILYQQDAFVFVPARKKTRVNRRN